MIHSGSRGLGYQVCDDSLAFMAKHVKTLDIQLPDRQLACAPIQSKEGRRYLSAMACAANYAYANRQIMLHLCRQAFETALSIGPKALNMNWSMTYATTSPRRKSISSTEKSVGCVCTARVRRAPSDRDSLR